MKCSNCGTDNVDGMAFCGRCGGKLAPSDVAAAQGKKERYCIQCGRVIGWDANACMYCGYDYRIKPKPGTEGFLMTGAVLVMLAGFLGIALLTLMASEDSHLSVTETSLLVISFVCAAMGVVGGFASLARRLFPIAVLGAACAIFTPAFFFAIPGLILVAKSANRFREYEKQI